MEVLTALKTIQTVNTIDTAIKTYNAVEAIINAKTLNDKLVLTKALVKQNVTEYVKNKSKNIITKNTSVNDVTKNQELSQIIELVRNQVQNYSINNKTLKQYNLNSQTAVRTPRAKFIASELKKIREKSSFTQKEKKYMKDLIKEATEIITKPGQINDKSVVSIITSELNQPFWIEFSDDINARGYEQNKDTLRDNFIFCFSRMNT
eukprot:g1190.t1